MSRSRSSPPFPLPVPGNLRLFRGLWDQLPVWRHRYVMQPQHDIIKFESRQNCAEFLSANSFR